LVRTGVGVGADCGVVEVVEVGLGVGEDGLGVGDVGVGGVVAVVGGVVAGTVGGGVVGTVVGQATQNTFCLAAPFSPAKFQKSL